MFTDLCANLILQYNGHKFFANILTQMWLIMQ